MSTTEQNTGELDGYGYAPESTGGKYLRLKNKGDSVIFRIVSNPCRFYANIVDGKTGDTLRKERFGWVVAHKEAVTVERDGKPERETKISIKGFEAGVAIWLAIREFAQDPEYGDPRDYDIKVTRTENAGRYYDIKVLPKSIGVPIEGVADMVKESGLTLQNLFLEKNGTAAPVRVAEEYNPFEDE